MTTESKPKPKRTRKPKACDCGVCQKASASTNPSHVAKQKAKCKNR